jgi:hypothetical protein
MADITPARKLFDLLVSRDFEPKMLDSTGRAAEDPSKTEIFSFDFRAESGKDYGTVVIMLGDDNDLEIYCSDNVGRNMESADKNDWFGFLEQLKNFATRNFMSFGIKNLNRLRYSMQGQAAINEGLFESWSGKKDISWNAGANQSRLMIKHSRNLGEDEARFRCVENLFIETAEGERYKLPFRNLTAGKAMLEHVRMGGKPYDMRGQHISEMVNELALLSRFRRANSGRLLEGDTVTLVAQANIYLENVKNNLKSLTTSRGYNKYFESWTPTELTEQEVVIEGLKHLFITQSIDQRIEDALPLIARIQQQGTEMKEANIFEAWADRLMEGTWQTPDTPEKQVQLIELMSRELPVGADATNATEQLYDLLGDDQLFDRLEELAERDANADARQVVYDRMQELADNPDVAQVMAQFTMDTDTPAEPTQEAVKDPTTQTEDPADAQQPEYPEYQDNLADILKNAGVPAEPRAAPDYEPEVSETANPGVTPADIDGVPNGKEELDEFAPLAAAIGGALGRAAVGATAGAIKQGLASMAGSAVGSAVGDAVSGDDMDEATCNMTEAGESCPQHGMSECGMEENIDYDKLPGDGQFGYDEPALALGQPRPGEQFGDEDEDEEEAMEESALQGQYGHSGKMKEVGKDTSFLDRLKELSGLRK